MLLSDFETEREEYHKEMESKHKRDIDQLRLKLRNEAADELEQAELAMKTRCDFETKLAVEKVEASLEQAHRDSIRSLDTMEKRLRELEKENDHALTEAAQERKLARSMEDKLEAAEREATKKSKEFAVNAWRLTVYSRRLQGTYEERETEMRTRHSKEETSMRTSLQRELSIFVLATLRLSRLCVNTEDLRKRMDESLRSYRVDDLNDKRRRIKLLERDIERLGSDRDSFEEQRKCPLWPSHDSIYSLLYQNRNLRYPIYH